MRSKNAADNDSLLGRSVANAEIEATRSQTEAEEEARLL